MFTKEKTERAAKDFKFTLNEALHVAGEKQENLALHLGVTQAQISAWLNPNHDRNFPLALLPMLPPKMVHHIMSIINSQIKQNAAADLNGSIDDEIFLLITLEGALAEVRDTDKKKAMRIVTKMRAALDRIEAECNQQTQ